MLIWDYIRDFLVQYIFGGMDSNGEVFNCCVGGDFNLEEMYMSGEIFVKPSVNSISNGTYGTDAPLFISIGDWLATTTTIIIMCLIVVLFAMLVRWVFKTVVSAFLLR